MAPRTRGWEKRDQGVLMDDAIILCRSCSHGMWDHVLSSYGFDGDYRRHMICYQHECQCDIYLLGPWDSGTFDYLFHTPVEYKLRIIAFWFDPDKSAIINFKWLKELRTLLINTVSSVGIRPWVIYRNSCRSINDGYCFISTVKTAMTPRMSPIAAELGSTNRINSPTTPHLVKSGL